jgi:hypothetical protein
LYEKVKAIDDDEDDDRAMGVDIPEEKLAQNAVVSHSSPPSFQQARR